MDAEQLRLLIRAKLADGRLAHDSIPRIWGGPGAGETCDGCDEVVTKPQMLMEGIGESGGGIQMHVACFYIWDSERSVLGHEPSAPQGDGPSV